MTFSVGLSDFQFPDTDEMLEIIEKSLLGCKTTDDVVAAKRKLFRDILNGLNP